MSEKSSAEFTRKMKEKERMTEAERKDWVVPSAVMKTEDDEATYTIRMDKVQAVKVEKEAGEAFVYLSGGAVMKVDAGTAIAVRTAWLKWVDFQVMNEKL